MEIYFAFMLGILVGLIIGFIIRPQLFGTLKIDNSNPAKDVYRLEIDNFDDLSGRKRITLRVDNNADLSHE